MDETIKQGSCGCKTEHKPGIGERIHEKREEHRELRDEKHEMHEQEREDRREHRAEEKAEKREHKDELKLDRELYEEERLEDDVALNSMGGMR